jgi:hypothetical protein
MGHKRRRPAGRIGTGKVKVVYVLFFNLSPRYESMFGEWRYSSTHSLISVLDGSDRLHAPATLPPEMETRYSLDRRLGWPQSRSERGDEEKNSQPSPGIEL